MGKTILISFSGGRTSTFMTKWILESEKYADYEKVVIFANTGKEREETLDFVNECDKRWDLGIVWLEAKFMNKHGYKNYFSITNYENASRNGEPFEAFIAKERIPNSKYPNCSGRLKSLPIHKYMNTITDTPYLTAIGIRSDEVQRINWGTAKKNNYIYPLVTDIRIDSKFIRQWWASQPFDLQLKDYEGNCDMCWKKSKRKLMTLILEKPELIEWWNEMEIKYGEQEYSFWRDHDLTQDIIDRAKNIKFNKSVDEFELSQQQPNLFDYNLDVGSECFCK